LRWRTVSPEALVWRDFAGEVVVRNARTGSTHLLDPFPAEVLRTLIETGGSMGLQDLLARMGPSAAGEGDEEEWSKAIQEVLSELERLGLAEPQPDRP
jgi:PqqD family protein of HPr-rel-A system